MYRTPTALILALGLAAGLVAADPDHRAPGLANPLVPGYFADPTIRRFGDTWYLYATTDGTNCGRGLPVVWSSPDFVHWTSHRLPRFYPTGFFWAPDVVQHDDGRYLLFHSHPCEVHGYAGGSPFGPWTSLTPGRPLVPDKLIDKVITLDGQTFRDDDGRWYLTWCTWSIYPGHGCGVGRFAPDMASFDRLFMVPNTQAERIFEAPFLFKRKGLYYLTYSCDHCEDGSYHLRYATSDRVDGVYKPGRTNPILATSPDRTVHGPGHHSCMRLGEDDWYVVYHRHNNPPTGGGYDRQVCADRMFFEEDGAIRPIVPTHRGVGALAPVVDAPTDLAFTRPVEASSCFSDDYRPSYAVDANNGTLWRPAGNALPAWLRIDLGRRERISRVHTQFEFASYYYQYLIETSDDGTAWRTFSDRRGNRLCGSPLVDHGEDTARFVRLTITGVERQGLPGAVWNCRVFADATGDPPQEQVRIEADDLADGPLVRWDDTLGMLGGSFIADHAQPMVRSVDGRKAVVFDGTARLIADHPVPRSQMGGKPFTIAAWVRTDADDERGAVAVWGGRLLAGRHWGWEPGDAARRITVPRPATAGWHHLAFTSDGATGTVFIDGRPAGSGPAAPASAGGMPSIGDGFTGAIAGLRIVNRCLWPAEIAGLAQERYEAPPAPARMPVGVIARLDARDLVMGSIVDAWPDRGGLGGAFTRSAGKGTPRVDLVAGVQAVVFDGASALGSERAVPASLSGNGAFTVAAWAFTRRVAESATLVNWAKRGGPDGSCASLMYGSHGGSGAASHWGWADMAWKGGAPAAGAWHHLALVFDGIAERIYVDGRCVDRESKMLWIHAGGRIHIGAADDGEEPFTGAIAALELHDMPLSDADIARLAGDRPASGVRIHGDAATLPYGVAADLDNQGMAGGRLRGDPPPVVADAGGRIALTFAGGQRLVGDDPGTLAAGTLVVVADGSGGCAVRIGDLAIAPGPTGWRHLAVAWDGTGAVAYRDGRPLGPVATARIAGPLVIGEGFTGAIVQYRLYERRLDADAIATLAATWTRDLLPPRPDPAVFAPSPEAITPTTVVMQAGSAADDGGTVQYLFTETASGRSSGWLDRPAWRLDGLTPDREWTMTVRCRDAVGNVTHPSAPTRVRTDAGAFTCIPDGWSRDHDFKAAGVAGTGWDGIIGSDHATAARCAGGRLHLEAPKSFWSDQEPKGLLLYRLVSSDFTAEVEVADMLGLARREVVGNQAGGLMVRSPTSVAKGAGESLLALSVFPAWGCGNITTSLHRGGRPEWTPKNGWDLGRFLQVQRHGDRFHCRWSPDGRTWTDMPGSPVHRPDLAGQAVQVGPHQVTHGGDRGWCAFTGFRIWQRNR